MLTSSALQTVALATRSSNWLRYTYTRSWQESLASWDSSPTVWNPRPISAKPLPSFHKRCGEPIVYSSVDTVLTTDLPGPPTRVRAPGEDVGNMKLHTFHAWGGHPPPGVGVTLKDVFPRLKWMETRPAPVATPDTVYNKYAFDLSKPDEYIPMPPIDAKMPFQIHGYFFSHRYWHHSRDRVLQLLEFNPAITRYLEGKYYHLLRNDSHPSVSVHIRLGYQGEPAKGLLHERKWPPKLFIEQSFSALGTKSNFLIFADDVNAARQLLSPLSRGGYAMHFIDENSVMSLKLMSMCRHHILTSSTLSFWGAYLDPRQPNGGRTLLHASFYESHGKDMIPYQQWEVFTDL